MRKVVLNLAISIDGFIAGPNGEYDWCLTDHDYGMTEFMTAIDSTVMGGKSYRLLLEYGPPYPELTNYVITRTETESPHSNVVFVRDNILSFVEELRNKKGKNIWLFGGAEITQMLMDKDLIDVLMLAVHPIALGGGVRLFGNFSSRKKFELEDSIRYPSGLVQLIYKVKSPK
jgi:dihydrofolate reductase